MTMGRVLARNVEIVERAVRGRRGAKLGDRRPRGGWSLARFTAGLWGRLIEDVRGLDDTGDLVDDGGDGVAEEDDDDDEPAIAGADSLVLYACQPAHQDGWGHWCRFGASKTKDTQNSDISAPPSSPYVHHTSRS